MIKYLSPLKRKDLLLLIGFIIVGFGWLLADQFFLPETYQRFIAFIILIFLLYYFQFAINKPIHVFYYANSIATITVSFIIIVSLIMHVIVHNDLTYKSVLIWMITAILPYLTGFAYMKTREKTCIRNNCRSEPGQ